VPSDSGSSGERAYIFLHLEDSPLDAELAGDLLKSTKLKHSIQVVDSRAGFTKALAENKFDLIIADYSLPDFDGLSALRLVRATDTRVPFIFLSGVLGEDVAVEALLSGATDYVTKQKMHRLVPAVLRALSEHEEFKSRQRAELDLLIGEERFRKLTDSLPSMVWVCNLEGQLTFTNAPWDRNVGPAACWWTPEIIHPSDLQVCESAWREAKLNHKPFELDCRYRMIDSEYRWHLVWGAPVEDQHGVLTGWVGTCTDTEQQKFRDAQLRNAEKLALTGRMASVIAHEINNPLEALTNLFYLLRGEAKPTALGEKFLAQAEQELLRMSTITRLTLQWSREGGSVSHLTVGALIDETLRLFRGKIQNKHIQLSVTVDSDVPPHTIAGEFRQVLANLLNNAIDALPVGGNIFLNATTLQEQESTSVVIQVQDEGIGIEPERLPHLFHPFRSTKGEIGNGLGLYISKEIVDRHKGKLSIESTVGLGTTATLIFPIASSITTVEAV
jgi:signal transduction histidine kinase/CheY-like chemotaxis protein